MGANRTKRFDSEKESIFRKELIDAVANGCGEDEAAIFAGLVHAGTRQEVNDVFTAQRKNVGRAHGLKNEIVQGSKVYIFYVKTSQVDAAKNARKNMLVKYLDLLEQDLPVTVREELIEMAAQELIEAEFVGLGYPYIFQGDKIPSGLDFPDPNKLYVEVEAKDPIANESPFENVKLDITHQSILSGATDSVTELSKLLTNHLLLAELPEDEEFQIISRYVRFSSAVCRYLSLFTGFPPGVVNSNHVRGQGLQSTLRRAEEAVYDWKRDLLQMKRQRRGGGK
ncbi:MAG: hypothetical protein Q7S36_00105 [Candidatus Liptonbacteria bacterium]|nr:hypothetical protein [Candidatus Liptonbacteria bacterium]